MNDWIILGIIVLVTTEVLFILERIFEITSYKWYESKLACVGIAIIFWSIHLLWLVEDISGWGEKANIIFHWNRLIYEAIILGAIAVFFLINYGIHKLIERKL